MKLVPAKIVRLVAAVAVVVVVAIAAVAVAVAVAATEATAAAVAENVAAAAAAVIANKRGLCSSRIVEAILGWRLSLPFRRICPDSKFPLDPGKP